jgi:hypothetical protein
VTSNIDTGSGLFKAFSTDGGATWTRDIIADGDALGFACCDSKASFDSFGNLFLVYLDSAVTKVQAAISVDGGKTFRYIGAVATGSPDFPGITTGPGSMWYVWTDTAANRVKARGLRVTGLGQLGGFGPIETAPGSDDDSFADIEVGPDGQVLVAYQHNGAPFQGPSGLTA